jgi:hypothetical protein
MEFILRILFILSGPGATGDLGCGAPQPYRHWTCDVFVPSRREKSVSTRRARARRGGSASSVVEKEFVTSGSASPGAALFKGRDGPPGRPTKLSTAETQRHVERQGILNHSLSSIRWMRGAGRGGHLRSTVLCRIDANFRHCITDSSLNLQQSTIGGG